VPSTIRPSRLTSAAGATGGTKFGIKTTAQAIGLTAGELRLLLLSAAQHSPRSLALVSLLIFCGLRIPEALNADIRDYGHDHGHRVLKVTRKGGKTARVALAPPVVRALDDYLTGRSTGRIFVARDCESRYGYKTANETDHPSLPHSRPPRPAKATIGRGARPDSD
jgi:integrase